MEGQSSTLLNSGLDTGTFAVACIVAIISFRQYAIYRLQLKRELFEDRFTIYKSAQKFLSGIYREAKLPEEHIPEFVDALQRSRFLFKPEIYLFLDQIYQDAIQLQVARENLKNALTKAARTKAAAKKSELLAGLVERLNDLHAPFRQYMDFEV